MSKSKVSKSDKTKSSGKPVIDDLARFAAEVVTAPAIAASFVIEPFGKSIYADLDRNAVMSELIDITSEINAGNMARPEAMLVAQAHALQSIFVTLSRFSRVNMGEYLGAAETYMRLALKAQSQCRTTIEALAELKNPRQTAFVRQQNIANGPQQVNNLRVGGAGDTPFTKGSPERARAEISENQPNELLEVTHEHGERLDTGATATAGGSNPDLETVGARQRSKNAGR